MRSAACTRRSAKKRSRGVPRRRTKRRRTKSRFRKSFIRWCGSAVHAVAAEVTRRTRGEQHLDNPPPHVVGYKALSAFVILNWLTKVREGLDREPSRLAARGSGGDLQSFPHR